MPHYYIDTDDGRVQSLDHEGEEFTDAEHARHCALAHLPALADQIFPDGKPLDFSVTLRSASGTALYVARLSYHGEWMGQALERRAG